MAEEQPDHVIYSGPQLLEQNIRNMEADLKLRNKIIYLWFLQLLII